MVLAIQNYWILKGFDISGNVSQAPPPTHLILVQNFGAELERLVPNNQ